MYELADGCGDEWTVGVCRLPRPRPNIPDRRGPQSQSRRLYIPARTRDKVASYSSPTNFPSHNRRSKAQLLFVDELSKQLDAKARNSWSLGVSCCPLPYWFLTQIA